MMSALNLSNWWTCHKRDQHGDRRNEDDYPSAHFLPLLPTGLRIRELASSGKSGGRVPALHPAFAGQELAPAKAGGRDDKGEGLECAEHLFSPTGEKVARMRRMRGRAKRPPKLFSCAADAARSSPFIPLPGGGEGVVFLSALWSIKSMRLARQRRVPTPLCFAGPSVSPCGRSTSPQNGEEHRRSPKKGAAFWFQGMSLGLLGQSESRMASKPYSDTSLWLVSTKRPAGMKESSEMALTWKKAWFSTVSMRAPR